MGLKQWHWGKILMLWIATPIAMIAVGLAAEYVGGVFTGDPILAIHVLTLTFSVVPLFAMVVVTWKWLGGKDRSPTDA